jgi:5-methylthioribose kinase
MFELTVENIVDYLRRTGRLPQEESARAEWLTWGVSNVVLRINRSAGDDFVIKQSRGRLRTKAAWFSRLDRIFREMEFLQAAAPLLPAGTIPRVLFADRENYLFAMHAIDADHTVWKAALLGGEADPEIADELGRLLAALHCRSAGSDVLREQFGDREVFHQLRVDPFYRRVAQVHPRIRPQIERMVEEMSRTALCLVHADFSPKNILVTGRGLALVDFETGHYGDPAFDLGFFLSHLLLKCIKQAQRLDDYAALVTTFWDRYVAEVQGERAGLQFAGVDFERRVVEHLAGCMLARIDGTSPVDYLTDSAHQDLVRNYCIDLYENPPAQTSEAFGRLMPFVQVIS